MEDSSEGLWGAKKGEMEGTKGGVKKHGTSMGLIN